MIRRYNDESEFKVSVSFLSASSGNGLQVMNLALTVCFDGT